MSLLFLGAEGAESQCAPYWASTLLMRALFAMLRSEFGYPSSEAAPFLSDSARHLSMLGVGDPERLSLLGSKWEDALVVPGSAVLDRQLVNEQIAELLPGWLS